MSDLSDLQSIPASEIKDYTDRKSWTEVLRDYGGKNLESKKTWYSAVADAYYRVRPRYPQEIIARTIAIAQLHHSAKILEIGCGPAIATVPLAELGFSVVGLEPNLEASQIAQQSCADHPQVQIINTSFEEWELIENQFDAVLAATSWHWLDPAIAYRKSAAALKSEGHLILLWNTPPQLDTETYQLVDAVYQALAPEIPLYARHEGKETHQADFLKFSESIINSGYFANVKYDHSIHHVTYSLEDYLMLLSTLSPYIALSPEKRTQLFANLQEILRHHRGDRLKLSFISAFHVARKI
ncbi:class I SAM-dependent methyltransferase [Pseudanabaena yagii]|uniref:Class I SAM-dependent methyltransferase n=1 Tax=Pseudanabaena yagii GIHE-NHR1 TaxID=2722753 RepID=A0ABX1LRE6_9CYAN|nr:class I SAM-dependent methyltransferase [Pseudanabaena yagii]NMF58086.1 class I SAM-dependent methyltransferase [Pseudanabaena yagii GIHE-NHR1]